MAVHNDLGQRGEQIAKIFLADHGYKILEENWRTGKSEIDLICLKDDVVIFVEVKTRNSAAFGNPEAFVNEKKVKLLGDAATEYIEQIDHRGEVRFDIVAILFKNKEDYTLNHINNAFWPD